MTITSHVNFKSWGLVLSVALSLGTIAFVFSTITISEVVAAIAGADRSAVAAFLVASFSASFFRVWRYRVLLRSNGYETPFPSMFLIVLVRNTFSDLLPARLGTLIYIFLTTTRLGIPFGAAGSSFALAFLFDIIAIVPLIFVCVGFASLGGMVSPVGLIFGGGILLALSSTLILLLPRALRVASNVCARLFSVQSSVGQTLLSGIASVAESVEQTRASGAYARVLVISILGRLCKYAGLYLFLYAMLIPRGYSLSDMPFSTVFLGLCASELAASLPISGIAGIGAYQGAWIGTFTLLGFPLSLATLTSIGHHLFTQAYGYSLGACAFLIVLLPFFKREVSKDSPSSQAPLIYSSNTMFITQLLGSVALIVGLISFLLGRIAT